MPEHAAVPQRREGAEQQDEVAHQIHIDESHMLLMRKREGQPAFPFSF
jgi:hypothetical protein